MIVVDSSALLEIVLVTNVGITLADQTASSETLHAPGIIDVEVLSAMNKLKRREVIRPSDGERALNTLRGFSRRRWDHRSLLGRAWALRHSFSAYDAIYVALAESLDARLLTLDRRLATATAAYAQASIVTLT